MAALAAWLAPVLADAAEEGKKVVLAMLAVGGIFVAVIALGMTGHWLRARLKERRAGKRPAY